MTRLIRRLSARITAAFLVLIVLVSAGVAYQWERIVMPLIYQGEQAKADLLIMPYTEPLQTAIDRGDTPRLNGLLTEIVLLTDTRTGQPMVTQLVVTLADGRRFHKRNVVESDAGGPFVAEAPLFSPRTHALVGTVRLEYNSAFYDRLVEAGRERMLVTIAAVAVLLLLGYRLIAYLVRPLRTLASHLEAVDFDRVTAPPPPPPRVSAEIRQVWLAMRQLLARLRERERELIARQKVAAQALLAQQAAEAESRAKSEFLTNMSRLAEEAQAAQRAAEVASRAKSAFLANMSHELRTPLNAVIGYSELLAEDLRERNDPSLADIARDAERIHTAGRHLLALISEILDLSKIEAGRMQLHLESFDVDAMVATAMDTAMPLAKKNNNTLERQGEPVGSMYADLTKVRQVLFNLLSNAAKFTHDGRIVIGVERASRDGRPGILFGVRDTGIGVAPEQISQLFQPFTQADNSTTRRYGGTGLGLAISRRFCEMMQGTIEVESALGQGATLTVWLPVTVSEHAATPVPAGRLGDGAVSERPARAMTASTADRRREASTVLVIDDDPAVHELVQRYLGAEGFRVVAAANGKEGLAQAQQLLPQAILLDVLMPGTDGWEVLSSLQTDEALRHIPVIMLTMVDDERATGFALGARHYLTKPVGREELIEAVRHHVRGRPPGAVLVVDSDAESRGRLCTAIAREGWPYFEARDAREARRHIEDDRLALVVLDAASGASADVLEAIRGAGTGERPPLIVLADSRLADSERVSLQQDAQRLLPKHELTAARLIDEIRGLVGGLLPPASEETGRG